MHLTAYFIISLFASMAGAICGIGGGVIIKPTLDMFRIDSIATINFLSGCTVLAMSGYTVTQTLRSGKNNLDLKTGTPLAAGAAIGGVLGKQLFGVVSMRIGTAAGAVQSLCLLVLALITVFYTLNRERVHTYRIVKAWLCLIIGLLLGMLSSFLGIGGGPINLVVLHFFFSMDMKAAAQNSLYIILFSQTASLLSTFAAHSVPGFSWLSLTFMITGGVAGGIIGHAVNRRIDDKVLGKLFTMINAVIMLICVYNMMQYMDV